MSAATESRPLPQPNEESQPFWDALKAHRLDFQTCADCGTVRHYPRPVCHVCHSMAVTWTTASGHGTVHSWTISHQAFHPAFANSLPIVLVTVDLDEGVRMNCRLEGIEPDDIEIGLLVEVAFEDVDEDLTLPFFRPRSGGKQL